MGLLADRFRLHLVRDANPQSRAIERWANGLPYPEVFFASLGPRTTITSTTFQPLSCAVAFNTYYPNTPILVQIIVDFNHSVTGTTNALGRATLDGVSGALGVQYAVLYDGGGTARGCVSQNYYYVIPDPGSHSVGIEARKLAAAGTLLAMENDTTLTVTVFS